MSVFDVDLAINQRLENMLDMMRRLGIKPALSNQAAAERVLASAVRVCEACPNGEICRDWLLRAAPTLYKAPPFCPNADRFAQLLAVEMMILRGKAGTTH
jgi:hypothetical protein